MYRLGNEKKQLKNKTLITTIFKLIFTNKYTTLRMAEQEYKTRKVKTKKKNQSHLKSKYMSGLRPVSLILVPQSPRLASIFGNPMS
jgi:hypothetical protein